MDVGNTIKELNEVINSIDLISYLKSINIITETSLKASDNLGVDGDTIALVFKLNKYKDTPKLRELLRREMINSTKLSEFINTINWISTEYDSSHVFVCHIVY
jgi:hypothetical protein